MHQHSSPQPAHHNTPFSFAANLNISCFFGVPHAAARSSSRIPLTSRRAVERGGEKYLLAGLARGAWRVVRGMCAVSSDKRLVKRPRARHASRALRRAWLRARGGSESPYTVWFGLVCFLGRFNTVVWGWILGGMWDCARGISPPRQCLFGPPLIIRTADQKKTSDDDKNRASQVASALICNTPHKRSIPISPHEHDTSNREGGRGGTPDH